MLNLGRKLYSPHRFTLSNVFAAIGRRPQGVMHLGGNVGTEAAEYEALGIKKVVWVEGYPPFFEHLQRAISGLSGHEAYCFFISDVDNERLTFRLASNTGSSTVLLPAAGYESEFPGIEFGETSLQHARRVDSVFSGEARAALVNCDMLVVDLEGAELKALRSMGELMSQFSFVLCEIALGPVFVGGPLLHDIDAWMLSRGFARRRIWIGLSTGDALYVRVSASPIPLRGQLMGAKLLEAAHRVGYYNLRRECINWVKRVLLGQEAHSTERG